MRHVFQLILPFQLDLPFDQPSQASHGAAAPVEAHGEGKRRQRRGTAARSEPLPERLVAG
jgi:hypothetical protein